MAADLRPDPSSTSSFLALLGMDDFLSLRRATSPVILDRARGERGRD
jgi:hypothetical protein